MRKINCICLDTCVIINFCDYIVSYFKNSQTTSPQDVIKDLGSNIFHQDILKYLEQNSDIINKITQSLSNNNSKQKLCTQLDNDIKAVQTTIQNYTESKNFKMRNDYIQKYADLCLFNDIVQHNINKKKYLYNYFFTAMVWSELIDGKAPNQAYQKIATLFIDYIDDNFNTDANHKKVKDLTYVYSSDKNKLQEKQLQYYKNCAKTILEQAFQKIYRKKGEIQNNQPKNISSNTSQELHQCRPMKLDKNSQGKWGDVTVMAESTFYARYLITDNLTDFIQNRNEKPDIRNHIYVCNAILDDGVPTIPVSPVEFMRIIEDKQLVYETSLVSKFLHNLVGELKQNNNNNKGKLY